MSELIEGETVQLTAPDLMLDDGSLIYAGERGMVVGFRGFTEVIVSWGSSPPYRTGAASPNDLRRASGAKSGGS